MLIEKGDYVANSDSDLQLLLDERALSRLLVSVTRALDRKDWQAYAQCFTEEGSFEIMGQARHGRKEIAAGPVRDLERYDRLQHFSANHSIAVDGDSAEVSHYLIGVHVPSAADPSVHADIGGHYDCRCVRTDAGWKFAEMRLEIIWTAGHDFGVEPREQDAA
jgi:uncharacterized protein (TIGR02246 family)